jgi:putative peptidoglycan lipid II flippase
LGIAPGFESSQQVLVAELMRLNLIATLIFSISGLVMAGLQANQHFLLPAIAPLLYNLGQIFGALILAPGKGNQLGPIPLPGFGLGVYGLVYGVIIGAALHLLIQVPALFKYQFRWTPRIGLNDPGVRQVLRLLGPRLLTMLFIQLTFIARDNLASRLAEGAVTALTYGWMIMQVPETLIGTAVATALLPTLAEQAAGRKLEAFRQTIEKAVRVLTALTIPIAAVIAVGVAPLISLAFDFGEQGTILVTWVTIAYLGGIAGHSLLEIAARSFYAQQEARLPLLAAGINALLFAGLALLLMPALQAVGIALANTIAFTSEAILLFFLLRPRLDSPLRIGSTLPRALASALLAGGIAFGVMRLLASQPVIGAVLGMGLGFACGLPLIWREIRLMARL